MPKKQISIRVIRAAIQRHNDNVRLVTHRRTKQVTAKAMLEIQTQLASAQQLLAAVVDIREKLRDAGWDTDICTQYNKLTVTMNPSLSAKKLEALLTATYADTPKCVSEDEVILALAESGEDDVAKALDKIGLLWKKTK